MAMSCKTVSSSFRKLRLISDSVTFSRLSSSHKVIVYKERSGDTFNIFSRLRLELNPLRKPYGSRRYTIVVNGLEKSYLQHFSRRSEIRQPQSMSNSSHSFVMDDSEDKKQDSLSNLNDTSSKSTKPTTNSSQPLSRRSSSIDIDIDQLVFQLKMDVRKLKRVFPSDLCTAIEILEQEDSKVAEHGTFLLSSCGNLVPDLEAPKRNILVDRVWKVITRVSKSSGCPGVENFEALLKVYSENDNREVEPFQILDDIKALQLPVTDNIYYYALLLLCQRGDIVKSSQVLNSIKAGNIFVSERFFNALILGNSRAGDVKGAAEILKIMEASQIEPSSKTYFALMQAYIETGQLENLEDTFKLAISKPDFLDDSILYLLKVAAVTGNASLVADIRSWIREVRANYFDVVNTVKEIVRMGHTNEALEVVKAFLNTLKMHGEPVAGFFIREIISTNENSEVVRKICRLLVDEDINEYALYIATEWSYREKRYDLAEQLLQDISDKNLILRPHYFLPLIVHQYETNGLEGLTYVLDKMKLLDVPLDWATSYSWIVPRLLSVLNDPIEVARVMKITSNVSSSPVILSAILAVLLKQNQVKDASVLVRKTKGKITKPNILTQQLSHAILKIKEIKHLEENLMESVSILQCMQNVSVDDKVDYIGAFLVRIMRSVVPASPKLWDRFLSALVKADVSVSQGAFDTLAGNEESNLRLKVDPDKIFHDGFFNNGPGRLIHPREMDLSDLECHVEELKSKNFNTRGALRKLFLKSCQANNLSKALQAKEIFESQFGQLSVGMNSALLGVYVNHKLLKPALEVYSQLKVAEITEEDVVVDFYKVLDLATLMLTQDLVQEAVDLLKKDGQEYPPPVDPRTITRNVINFLEALANAERRRPGASENSILKDIVDLFIDKSIAEAKGPVIGILIKHYLNRGEVDRAVEEFVYYSRKYKITPCRQQLTYEVLNKPDFLKEIYICCAEVLGEVTSNHELAFAKSDVGDLEGAAKILLNLGNQIKFTKILKQCEFLSQRRELDKILNLAKALRATKRNHDCTKLYRVALRGCQRFGDKEGYRRVLGAMEDEDMYIPPEILQYGRR